MRALMLLAGVLLSLASTTPPGGTTPQQWCSSSMTYPKTQVCSATYGGCLDSKAAQEAGGTSMGYCQQR
jgi:hypothetical protein